ncbi:hypothetical protein ACHAWF_004748, partial [Thalassiosira exigua]
PPSSVHLPPSTFHLISPDRDFIDIDRELRPRLIVSSSSSSSHPFYLGPSSTSETQIMGMFGSSKRSAGSGKSSGPSADDDGSGFLHPESTLASNRSLRESEWSKERSSQQLELEDVHAKSEGGCCRRLIEYAVQGLLFVDAAGGIASIVYGSLLITQFEKPAMAAATFCLILGTAHLATSLVGVLSLFLGGCSRAGLIVSGFMGPYFAMVYLTILISFLVDESGFLTYLDDHKEVMYLGPNVAQNVKNLMPLLYVILIVLGMLEASR